MNILHPSVIKEVLGDEYTCSYEIEQYVSYPRKNEVLDYVVIPNAQCKFKGIKCGYDNCSDHRALIVDISMTDEQGTQPINTSSYILFYPKLLGNSNG